MICADETTVGATLNWQKKKNSKNHRQKITNWGLKKKKKKKKERERKKKP